MCRPLDGTTDAAGYGVTDRALLALRADLNPAGFGVLWDLANLWMATTPAGGVVVSSSPDGLRRAVREIDGTTGASTASLPRVEGE